MFCQANYEKTVTFIKKLASDNFFNYILPTSCHGLGKSFLSFCNLNESIGEDIYNPGLVLSAHAHLWGGVYTLLLFGNELQKSDYLPAFISADKISGHAITEAGSGSNAMAIASTAKKVDNDYYILNGSKRYISNAPIASQLIVYVNCDDQLSAFLVDAQDAGVEFNDNHQVNSCVDAPIGEVVLHDVKLSKERLIGVKGAGASMIQAILELERVFLFSAIIGVMKKQLKNTLHYVKRRCLGNQRLINNQVISHRLSEMQMRLDTSRHWVHHCARLKDNNQRITMASTQAKLYISEVFLKSSIDAIHLQGGYGLEVDRKEFNFIHDAMASRLFSGSSEIQRNIIASMMGAS